jgi:hypothetical protein
MDRSRRGTGSGGKACLLKSGGIWSDNTPTPVSWPGTWFTILILFSAITVYLCDVLKNKNVLRSFIGFTYTTVLMFTHALYPLYIYRSPL